MTTIEEGRAIMAQVFALKDRIVFERPRLTDEQKALEDRWNELCYLHSKAAAGKGTTGTPGIRWEHDRLDLYNKLIKAGLRTKKGYTPLG